MIRFFQVHKAYPGQDAALVDVDIEASEGEFLILWGPSGAGKSTFLRLLLGAEAPTQGQVLVGERNLARLSRKELARHRQSVGVVFQDFRLLSRRSVLDNVRLPLVIRGAKVREADEEAIRWLDELGLGDRLHAPVERLSGGERQRVAIARALVGAPPLLLVDEPTSQLDAHWARKAMELFFDQTGRGALVVLATHDPMFLENLSHRRVRIRAGRIQEEG
ncbi:MAG TPA: ABC transporter ATP-binding protein [Fredinandcohnia sp.]|nr:ABC transporter ATP-binding protein [Fredinandcohnia sp.]